MKTITLSQSGDSDQRFDKFIKKFFPNAPLGGLYKMIRTGKIKVNKKKKPLSYRLQENDEIQFFLTDDEFTLFRGEQKSDKKPSKKPKLDILYQDDFLMVVNKPAGINVHPWDYKSDEISLIQQIHDCLGEKYNTLTFKPSLVHRIDRDTSGCILIALEKSTLVNLLDQLQNHKIEKIYHTIWCGKLPHTRGKLTDKILRIENAKNEAKVKIDEKGQKAITHYKVLSSTQIDNFWLSLVECRLETGRTHQIRVQLSFNNCPILWDKTYGNKKVNSYFDRHFSIKRQMLHAQKLSFIHPKTQKKIVVEAPYFSDFKGILKYF